MLIIKKVKEYEQAVKSGKSFYMDSNDLLDVYDYYIDNQRELDAAACLHKALLLHPKNEDVLVAYAICLRSLDKRVEAINVIKSVENQSHPDVLLFYGENELSKANLDGAEGFFNAIPHDEQPYQWRMQYDIAQIYFDYGYYQKANEWLDKCDDSKNPEYRQVQELRAKICFTLGQYAQAEQLINKSIDANPYDETSWLLLSDVQLMTEQYGKALESIEYVLAFNTKSKQAIRNKLFALLYNSYKSEDFVKTFDYYKSLPEGIITDSTLLCELADKMISFDKVRDAEKVIISALPFAPVGSAERINLLCNYVNILVEKGELKNTKQILQSASINSLNYQKLMNDYIIHLLWKGYTEEALADLKEIIESDSYNYHFAGKYIKHLIKYSCFESARFFWEHCFKGYKSIDIEYVLPLAFVARELKSTMYSDIIEYGGDPINVNRWFYSFSATDPNDFTNSFYCYEYFKAIYSADNWEDVTKCAKNEVKSWKIQS